MTEGVKAMIHLFREFGSVIEKCADNLVKDLQQEIASMPSQQKGLGGDPWAPSKLGSPVLRGSSGATSVRRAGNIIWLTLRGHEVYHQAGAGKLPVRAVLPSSLTNAKIGSLIRNNFAVIPRALAGELKK